MPSGFGATLMRTRWHSSMTCLPMRMSNGSGIHFLRMLRKEASSKRAAMAVVIALDGCPVSAAPTTM
jgi:hypothetical protein